MEAFVNNLYHASVGDRDGTLVFIEDGCFGATNCCKNIIEWPVLINHRVASVNQSSSGQC